MRREHRLRLGAMFCANLLCALDHTEDMNFLP